MTGLIYVAIVALWAVVLVPMWLRRHDLANESRNVDRFSSAMRTLSRSRTRHAVAYGDREIVQPRRNREREVVVTGARGRVSDRTRADVSQRTPERVDERSVRVARAAAAARRRRVLLLLTGTVVMVGLAAFAGRVPVWSVAVAGVLLAGFLAVSQRQVRAQRRADGQRRSRSARAGRATRAARFVDLADEAPRAGRRLVEPAPVSDQGFGRPARSAAFVGAPAQRGRATGTDAHGGFDGAWEPVPQTLPTYVTAPGRRGSPGSST